MPTFAAVRLRELVAWVLTFVCLGAGAALAMRRSGVEDTGLILLIGIVSSHGPLLGWSLASCRKAAISPMNLALPLPRPWPWGAQLLAWLAGLTASAGAGLLIEAVAPSSEPNWPLVDPGGSHFPLATEIMMVVAVIVVAPLVEELAFRGVLQRVLSERFGAARGLFYTAAAFGLLHGRDAAGITILGLVLGALALRTQSLALAVLGHFLHNGTVLLLAMSASDADEAATDLPFARQILLGAGLLLFSLALVGPLWRWANAPRQG